jgi:hypothetical protein
MIVEGLIMIWRERITSRSLSTAESGYRSRPTIQSFSHSFIQPFLLGYLPNLTDFCSI